MNLPVLASLVLTARPGQDQSSGLFTSTVFPGLWLDVEALLQINGSLVMDTLRRGLATPAHAALVQQLQRQRQA